MSYAINLTPDAETDLVRLPGMFASYVLDQLDVLAKDPVRLSRPPSFPHPLFQKYQFVWPPNGPTEAYVTVLFQYTQDETTLNILGIGVQYW